MEMFLGGDILIEILEIFSRYQICSEPIADRQNIIEMFLVGDILIEILEIICRYHRYSETIADRQNTIEKFLGGKREKTVGGHLSELGGTSSWRKAL